MNDIYKAVWRTIENDNPMNDINLLTQHFVPGFSDQSEFKQIIEEASSKLIDLAIKNLADYPDSILETSTNVIDAIKQYRTLNPGTSLLQARYKLTEQVRAKYPNPF